MAQTLDQVFEEMLKYAESLPKAKIFALPEGYSFVGWQVVYSEDLSVKEYREWGFNLEHLQRLASSDFVVDTQRAREAIAEALQKTPRAQPPLPSLRATLWQLLLKD